MYQLLYVVNLPRFKGMPVKIHTLAPMPPAEFATLMDPEVIGDVCPDVPMPKHLVFEAKVWFHVLAETMIPRLNVHDEYHILAFVQHALMKLVHGVPFEYCFIRILVSCGDDHTSLKPYAPWLMALCNFSRPEPFPSTMYPSIYTPPVRDVL